MASGISRVASFVWLGLGLRLVGLCLGLTILTATGEASRVYSYQSFKTVFDSEILLILLCAYVMNKQVCKISQ